MASGAGARDTTPTDPAVASAGEVAQEIERLRRAQRQLAARPADSIIAALDAVIAGWLAPDSSWRARAEALLPEATGFSPQMIRAALPTMLEPLRPPAVAELVASESAGQRGPALILHVLAGNLPGLAAIPSALSLAVGSAVMLKAGSGDRIFPALFAASIAERDAELGACIAPCYWRGGDRACEEVALAAADLVVASGDDETIADLARRTHGRFIGHGHRVSFAVVAREVATDSRAAPHAAACLAEDVALWDQRGCLSPQLCFVEGDLAAAIRFAELVAAALRPLATRWPAAAVSTGERLAVRRFRETAEWRSLGGAGGALFAVGTETEGTVVVEPVGRVLSTPLCRSLRIMPVADLGGLGGVLAPARSVLEGAGVAASAERWDALAADLTAAGVYRVCALGVMQRPSLDWQPGGRPRLREWVQGEG